MSAFEHKPYFLKCHNCGKIHLYEHIEERYDKGVRDIECPSCGTILDENDICEDIKTDSWFSYA